MNITKIIKEELGQEMQKAGFQFIQRRRKKDQNKVIFMDAGINVKK